MIVMNALYRKPENEADFRSHYDSVHMPLVQKIPGLLKAEAEYVSQVFVGEKDDIFMIARMYFEDADSFKAAMKSPENQATGKDLRNFAQAGVSVFVTRSDV